MMLSPEKIEAKIERLPESGCWLWSGTVEASGYGVVRVAGKAKKAHRVVYESIVGPIPEGLFIDHLCRVRCCVNPSHLEPVTHRTNVLRGISFAALNARKEFCDNGHPLTDDNLVGFIKDHRQCRICWAKYKRETKRRTRAKRRKPLKANNTSGVNGVYPVKGSDRWAAEIRVNKKRYFLGRFDDIASALAARKAGEIKYRDLRAIVTSVIEKEKE